MKENKELHKIYSMFANELISIQRGSQNVTEKKSPLIKIFKKNTESISVNEFETAFEAHKKIVMARHLNFNASFLYCFSIFERFLTEISKHTIKKDKGIKERYNHKFLEYMSDQLSTANNKNDTKRILAKMMNGKNNEDFYDDLESKYKVFGLTKYLFEVNEESDYYQFIKFKYTEARLRRNLIAHRGFKIDTKYKQSLKDETSPSDYKKYIKTIYRKINLVGVPGSDGRAMDQDPDNPINLSITLNYLRETMLSLLYLGTIFYLSAVDKAEYGKMTMPLLDASIEFKNLHFAKVAIEISTFILEIKLKGDLSKIDDIFKLNYMTSLSYAIEGAKKKPSYLPANLDTEKIIKKLDQYKDKVLDSMEDKRFANFLIGYVDKDINKIIAEVKNIRDKGLLTKKELDEINKGREKKLPKAEIKRSGEDFINRNANAFYFNSRNFIKNNKEIKKIFISVIEIDKLISLKKK